MYSIHVNCLYQKEKLTFLYLYDKEEIISCSQEPRLKFPDRQIRQPPFFRCPHFKEIALGCIIGKKVFKLLKIIYLSKRLRKHLRYCVFYGKY
jgi:hypothetical protein